MEQLIPEQPATITIKPRSAVIAFFLSLLLPGLGQVYNGQPKKAVVFFSLLPLIALVFGLTRGVTFFYGLLCLLVITIALRIYVIIDGVRNAKRQQEYVLKPYNTWYYYLLIAIGMLTTLVIFDSSTLLGIQTFKIPTPSQNPTLQVGDWLVADMRAYKNNGPDYGDIIVYSGLDGEIYTFRVVGLPNDQIEIIDNIVSINGKLSKATFIKDTTSYGMQVVEFEEELPNGHKHLIYKTIPSYDSTMANITNIVVPSDSYFLLGDNRDNAADSRYTGFISKDSIKGRMLYSYRGKTIGRINIDFRNK